LNKLLAASSLFQALGGGWTPTGQLSSLQPQDGAVPSAQ
jgi:multidrug efflux system outer membrane protein